MDSLAEQYAPYSPYNYVLGNPMRFIDPNGMRVEGDYFTGKGIFLGSDGKVDGKIYVRDDKGEKTFGTGILKNGDKFSEIDLDSDLGLLARIGFAEFRDSNDAEQQAGMDITLNRVGNPKFESTLDAVIRKPYQYSSLNAGDDNKPYFDNPLSKLKESKLNEQAWRKVASNAIKVYQGDKRGLTSGAVLYYSPRSMKPKDALPGWNFKLLDEVVVPGVRPSHLKAFKYK